MLIALVSTAIVSCTFDTAQAWSTSVRMPCGLLGRINGMPARSGEINELYAKWFTKPVPPAGVNLNYPMPKAVREAYANPNNKGI